MRVFEVEGDPTRHIREDGKPGFTCGCCGNGYATAAARTDHTCEAVNDDFAVFETMAGWGEEGFTADDITALNKGVRTVEFACVWDYLDDLGFGGDARLVARETLSDGSAGPWCVLDGQFEEYILNATSGVDLSTVETPLGQVADPYPGDLPVRVGGNFALRGNATA